MEKVEADDLQGDYLGFVKKNALQHKFSALELQSEGVSVPVESNGQMVHVPWDSLERVDTANGFAFKRNGETLFETDRGLRLTREFTVLHKGIVRYDPADHNLEPRPFMHQDPSEWGGGHRLQVCIAIKDVTGKRMQKVLGDHAYFRLYDDDKWRCVFLWRFAASDFEAGFIKSARP